MRGPIVKIPKLRSISEALNAYNVRRRSRRRRAWGWVEPKILSIPHYTVNIVGDASYNPSSTNPGDPHKIFEDFAEQWPSLVTWPRRRIQITPGCVKYRLAFFIHKHPPEGADALDKNINTSYSVSIWDREVCTPTGERRAPRLRFAKSQHANLPPSLEKNDELCWHDPWPTRHTRRRRNITRYWRDCQTAWRNNGVSNVDFHNILQIHNQYRSLAHLQGCSYRSMEPRFSYWSVIGIILWCMNNIDNPAPLRPPDTEEVFSAMAPDLLPSFFVYTFMTLYENVFQHHWGSGSRAAHINFLSTSYKIEHNRYFAEQVHSLFQPLLVANGGPLPSWAVRAVTGI